MTPPRLTDSQLERAARLLCERMGLDPDAVAIKGSEYFGTQDRLNWHTATAKIRQTYDLLAVISAVTDAGTAVEPGIRAIIPPLADHEADLQRMQAVLAAQHYDPVSERLLSVAWQTRSEERHGKNWQPLDGYDDGTLLLILIDLLNLP